jgi:plasmid stabilization system protein ParE
MPVERRIEWADMARDDLRAIVFHIAKDSPAAASAVAERLELRASKLAVLSTRGRIVPELRCVGDTRYRELIETPWRIIYLVDGRTVQVVAVVDGRRDLREWLHEQAARFRLAKS